MKIKKLLVANRGEIAVRVVRACREMGIATVAVYSEADREARHVQMADEAYAIGSAAEAARAAREIGYPVMLKAAMGGGGKGMRLVRRAEDLPEALRAARAEAAAAFGDAAVYLERAVAEPRHIEIQILADAHGKVIHLGERECSIQRRHQKLVEECPSPLVDSALRERMGEAACRLARTSGYVNAGTVEFLVDADRNFYFLEMNTRLQVEHPVTEMVTGIDLVREQLRIAAGAKLALTQSDVTWRGWAIECRINAEDPFAGWLPSPGTLTGLRAPSGPWVRDDSGAYEGYTVPRWYDTLISKLIVWGADREAACDRMARALAEYRVVGVRTTIPVLARVVAHPDFRAGRLSTGFLERVLPALRANESRVLPIALIAAVLAEYERARHAVADVATAATPSAWLLGRRTGWPG